MVLRGIGIARLPMSMIWRDREAGQVIDLTATLGSCPLSICLYANTTRSRLGACPRIAIVARTFLMETCFSII